MPDFSTPEAAIQSLESAYKNRDIEAAVACKNFPAEAEIMIRNLNPKFAVDEEILSQTAEVLELAYRKEIAQTGFPDFDGIESTFPKTEMLNDCLAIVTEICEYPDGETSIQQLYVYKTDSGWRVLNPISAESARRKKWWQFWR